MTEPNDEEHVERRVVYENVSSSTTRGTGIIIAVLVILAIALVIFIWTHR